jgi:hypothetical protein
LCSRPGERRELFAPDWCRFGSCRLAGDVPQQILIFCFVFRTVVIAASYRFGDVLILSAFEQNGDELRTIGVVVIDLLIGKEALPFDSLACSFLDFVSRFGQVVSEQTTTT